MKVDQKKEVKMDYGNQLIKILMENKNKIKKKLEILKLMFVSTQDFCKMLMITKKLKLIVNQIVMIDHIVLQMVNKDILKIIIVIKLITI